MNIVYAYRARQLSVGLHFGKHKLTCRYQSEELITHRELTMAPEPCCPLEDDCLACNF